MDIVGFTLPDVACIGKSYQLTDLYQYTDFMNFNTLILLQYLSSQYFQITAEKHDKKELGRLLQLILGCAVTCDGKQGNLCTKQCILTLYLTLLLWFLKCTTYRLILS
jgi:hypothetical protein